MDMSNKFRSGESHVAQQSRRDKLRVQQHLEEDGDDFPISSTNLDQVGNSNILQYDPTLDNIPSGIIHGSASSNIAMLESSFPAANLSKLFNSSSHHSSSSSSSSDNWMVGYANASGLVSGRDHLQVLSNNNARESVIYHNANLQADVVTTANSVGRGNSWMDYCTTTGMNQAITSSSLQPFDHNNNYANWMMNNQHCQQWGSGGELGFLATKAIGQEPTTTHHHHHHHQGLSLSLSSNPTSKSCGGAAQLMSTEDDQYGSDEFKEQKLSVISKGNGGKSIQDTACGTSSSTHRQHTGPLGPFTGYATILKSSRFLKPAQDLLDDFCQMTNSKLVNVCVNTSEGISRDVSGSASAVEGTININAVDDMEAEASKEINSLGSSSTFYSTNELRVDVGGVGSSRSSVEPCRPEYQQKKAKLLYLQEEVCRRYKLYHQQMQMVVSSFESVAGLSAATPYISLALKTVARNFRCLRNAISDQIRYISRALGEDLLSPAATGTSNSKGDINMSRLKYVGQKSGGVNMGFLEPQQHGWRPQRGLPERSVAILRAWLFEHFLHPYPTDTDKHMLATQTGLSRNQVSNWFINARVRVWKPMVEEIHMLESKGLAAEGNHQHLSIRDGKSTCEGSASRPSDDQSINRSCINAMSDKQLACMDMLVPAGITGDAHDTEHWSSHDKRSRMDFHIPTSMETASMMGFAPYQQSRLEMGGLGAVSLTLGLRHGVESAQQHHQQQYHQRQEDQLRRQYGGHMIHDFSG